MGAWDRRTTRPSGLRASVVPSGWRISYQAGPQQKGAGVVPVLRRDAQQGKRPRGRIVPGLGGQVGPPGPGPGLNTDTPLNAERSPSPHMRNFPGTQGFRGNRRRAGQRPPLLLRERRRRRKGRWSRLVSSPCSNEFLVAQYVVSRSFSNQETKWSGLAWPVLQAGHGSSMRTCPCQAIPFQRRCDCWPIRCGGG